MTPRYSIGVVSSRIGVSVGALRHWENEYGLLTPRRSKGGTRLYSDADVEAARSIHQLVHHLGYSLATLSRMHDEVRSVRAPELDTQAVLNRIVRAENLWKAGRALVEGVRALTGVASARLGLYQQTSNSLAFIVGSLGNEIYRVVCPPVLISHLPSSWQRALLRRQPHADEDLRRLRLPDFIKSRLEKERVRSLYAEPLIVSERLVGILAVGVTRPGKIPLSVRAICERLVVPAGPAIAYLADQS